MRARIQSRGDSVQGLASKVEWLLRSGGAAEAHNLCHRAWRSQSSPWTPAHRGFPKPRGSPKIHGHGVRYLPKFNSGWDNSPSRKVLWLHDVAGIRYCSALPEVHRIIDRYFFIREWQKDGCIKAYSVLIHKVYVPRKGVDPILFDRFVKREQNKRIYINTPFRGLAPEALRYGMQASVQVERGDPLI